MPSVGKRIDALRREKGLSVSELSRRLNVTRVAITRWLKDESEPKEENIEAMSNLFGVPPSFLRYGFINGDSVPQTLKLSETEVSIPLLSVNASCGYGALADANSLIKMMRVERAWLSQNAIHNYNIDMLNIITADGDSMSPTITNGSLVIVDVSQKELLSDGIYIVAYSGAIYIKRLQRMPGFKVLVVSDNTAYRPFEIDASTEDFHIVGKCIMTLSAESL